MFVASKYEEVIPLMMKTMVNKIAHTKFSREQIQEKEIEILKALQFKMGVPTVKEFIDLMVEEL